MMNYSLAWLGIGGSTTVLAVGREIVCLCKAWKPISNIAATADACLYIEFLFPTISPKQEINRSPVIGLRVWQSKMFILQYGSKDEWEEII